MPNEIEQGRDPRVEWKPISCAPQGEGWHVQWIMGRLPGGIEVPVHYAFGDGEGLMPPFRGWFRKCGKHDMCGVDPTEWRPLTDEEMANVKAK